MIFLCIIEHSSPNITGLISVSAYEARQTRRDEILCETLQNRTREGDWDVEKKAC